MKSLLLLVAGAAAGFVAAHYIAKTPQGRAFFDQIDAQASQFGQAVAEGYHSREAELREAMASAQDVIDDLTHR